jgi:hypothetical protein
MRLKSTVAAAALAVASTQTHAAVINVGAASADYDFYVNFTKCKTVVGYLILSHKSLKVMRGGTTIMGCNRQSSGIRCDFIFKAHPEQKGRRGNSAGYKVIIDSPPLLHFLSNNGAEYVAINTSQRAATLTSRAVHQQFLGSKVCQGFYTTRFEVENLGGQ